MASLINLLRGCIWHLHSSNVFILMFIYALYTLYTWALYTNVYLGFIHLGVGNMRKTYIRYFLNIQIKGLCVCILIYLRLQSETPSSLLSGPIPITSITAPTVRLSGSETNRYYQGAVKKRCPDCEDRLAASLEVDCKIRGAHIYHGR